MKTHQPVPFAEQWIRYIKLMFFTICFEIDFELLFVVDEHITIRYIIEIDDRYSSVSQIDCYINRITIQRCVGDERPVWEKWWNVDFNLNFLERLKINLTYQVANDVSLGMKYRNICAFL